MSSFTYRHSRLLFCALLMLLLTTQRLPAPISEVPQTTPPPKPKQAAPKIKSKPEATPKPKATPNRSFAGTWSGSVIAKASDGSDNSSATYIIRISDDEKTVWINWNQSGQPISGPGYQAPCNRFRETLTWSFTFPASINTDTLRINTDGTASFVREGKWTSGDNEGITYNHTGTFSRPDVSSAPSLQQTAAPIATAAPKSVGGLPVAKPVPDKPGFVYNPFDSNTKVLLDVRGKASGTKVKDPFSGKLFVVP